MMTTEEHLIFRKLVTFLNKYAKDVKPSERANLSKATDEGGGPPPPPVPARDRNISFLEFKKFGT